MRDITPTENRRPTHRFIRERWVIKGQLVLDSPTNFGLGSADDISDMPILVDETDGIPFIPGTSLAGALRNYLREIEQGFNKAFPKPPKSDASEEEKEQYKAAVGEERDLMATQLFGGHRGDEEGIQSPFIIYDARCSQYQYELRDGVKIAGDTRTAYIDDRGKGQKFDIQLLSTGTTYDLHFELSLGLRRCKSIPDMETIEANYQEDRQNLLELLATVLKGLQAGEIALGTRKRRGYGQCHVEHWSAQYYDMQQTNHLLAWLVNEQDDPGAWQKPVPLAEGKDIATVLDVTPQLLTDKRRLIRLTATFGLEGSILIRSGFGIRDNAPDMVHLHAYRGENERVPVISGTSWAGVLRHRAVRIVQTLADKRFGVEEEVPVVDDLFGRVVPLEPKEQDKVKASRLSVAETEIVNGRSWVQTRVKIDSFTGGSYQSALFDQQPLFGTPDTRIKLELQIRVPEENDDDAAKPEAETGLILLLLKDLWTGDLCIGGETSVGRGRLCGKSATLCIEDQEWVFDADSEKLLKKGDPDKLEQFVVLLKEEVTKDG